VSAPAAVAATDALDRLPARDCPVCGPGPRTLVFRQEFSAVDRVGLLAGYDVVVCDRCGCGFADRIPEQEAFDAYYRELSKYEYHQRDGAESEYDGARLQLIADTLAPFVGSRDARILDVGCATGRLLANLRDKGFANVLGLDPSPVCAAAARRLYDIEVRTTTLAHLSEMPEGTGAFDVLILVGVLEHIRDLATAMTQIRRVLAPGGIVYVEVPDALTFTEWPNAPFQDFSTEHINFFAPRSLANLMGVHGFSPVFSEQNARQQSYKTMMSNVSAVFRKDEPAPPFTPERDDDTVEGLRRYVAQSRGTEARLLGQIDRLVDAGTAIVVWGIGTHTSRLLATSRLREANIRAFVESNARYQGRELDGVPIIAPEALRGRDEPILISSRVFQDEISRQIRDDLGLGNELVTLYDLG
jgi:SAM-dependent methyltransferase